MKYVKSILIITICILITGCGHKTLKCIKKEKNETGNSIYSVTFNFDGKNITTALIENTFTVNDEYKEYFGVIANKFKEVLNTYKGKDGIETKFNSSDKEIKTTINFDLNKISAEDKKDIGFDYKGSIKSIRNFYESDGFKCE